MNALESRTTVGKRPPLSPSSEGREVFVWVNTPRSPTSTFDVVQMPYPQNKNYLLQQTNKKKIRPANEGPVIPPTNQEESFPFDEEDEDVSETESLVGDSLIDRFNFSGAVSLMRNMSTEPGDEEELLGLRFVDDIEGSKGEGLSDIGLNSTNNYKAM